MYQIYHVMSYRKCYNYCVTNLILINITHLVIHVCCSTKKSPIFGGCSHVMFEHLAKSHFDLGRDWFLVGWRHQRVEWRRCENEDGGWCQRLPEFDTILPESAKPIPSSWLHLESSSSSLSWSHVPKVRTTSFVAWQLSKHCSNTLILAQLFSKYGSDQLGYI